MCDDFEVYVCPACGFTFMSDGLDPWMPFCSTTCLASNDQYLRARASVNFYIQEQKSISKLAELVEEANLTEVRKCLRCFKTKHISDFPKIYRQGGKYHNICTDCVRERSRKSELKQCPVCGGYFIVAPSLVRGGGDRGKFCSGECKKQFTVRSKYRTCVVCGESKPPNEFATPKNKNVCRACKTSVAKFCTRCGELKPVGEFAPTDIYCAMCRTNYNKGWHEDNIEYDRARVLKWEKENPEKAKAKSQRRRARLAGAEGNWYNRDMLITLEAFGTDACPYCGGPLENMHWDHFVPLSAGGPTVLGNMVPVCSSCNLSKRDKLPQDFLPPDVYNYVEAMLGYLEQSQAEIDYQVLEMELFG